MTEDEKLKLISDLKSMVLFHKVNMAKRKTIGGKMFFKGQIKSTELIIQTLENGFKK